MRDIPVSRDILGVHADKIVKKIEGSADGKEALGATLRNCIELVRLVVDEKNTLNLESATSRRSSEVDMRVQ